MFHVELAPLGGIFGPLKSDLGVFWPFRGTDFIMGKLKIWDNFLGPHGPILKFTFLESLRKLGLFGINKKDGFFFFSLGPLQDPCDITINSRSSITHDEELNIVLSLRLYTGAAFVLRPSCYYSRCN